MRQKEKNNGCKKNLVVKSNSLIEARYRLSLQESRVILWLLTKIKPEDIDFKEYKLTIKEFSKVVELKKEGQYKELKKITQRLTERSIHVYGSNQQTLLQTSWLSSAFYEFQKGYVLLEFSPKLKPYLLQIKSHFTQIDANDILQLKSIYSIRIFELLKQYEEIGKRTINIEELRSFCGIREGKYRNYNGLKLYVVERASAEINAKTDYEIDYFPIKESRKIVALEWTIKKKPKPKSALDSKKHRSKLALAEDLREYGFSKPLISSTLRNNEEGVIQNALRAVDIQVAKGNVKNPKAMLRSAIKEQWHPDKYKPPAKD